MKVCIIDYPGSSAKAETKKIFEALGSQVEIVWHQEESLGSPDLVVLPGGYSYGDCLRPGALAKSSPASGLAKRFASKGGRVLGIGNGFQILTESGVLPGALLANEEGFLSDLVNIKIKSKDNSFTKNLDKELIKLPLACYFGRYWVDGRTLQEIEDNEQIAFRYVDQFGDYHAENPFNNSSRGVAGLLNRNKNVLGVMVRPERATKDFHASKDGLELFKSILSL